MTHPVPYLFRASGEREYGYLMGFSNSRKIVAPSGEILLLLKYLKQKKY